MDYLASQFSDFCHFAWSLLSMWQGRLTGGVLVAIVGAMSVWGKRFTPKMQKAVIIFWFFFAAFLAWQEKAGEVSVLREKVVVLQAKLDDNTPRLIAHVDSITSTNTKGELATGILSKVSIANIGTPSIAEKWTTVAVIDGKEIIGTPELLPTVFKIKEPGGMESFYREDEAIIKVGETPIEKGGRKEVLVWAKFLGMIPSQMEGVKILIRFQDVLGKIYTIQGFAPTGLGSPIIYQPGLRI